MKPWIRVILSNIVKKNAVKLVIDNDAGDDDAVAIFLALLNEEYCRLLLLIHHFFTAYEAIKIPIYLGAKDSLMKAYDRRDYYGVDGLGDFGEELIGLKPAQEENAVTALINLSKKHAGELSVLTLGPLTNIAMAIRLDPEFIGQLAHLYNGAGHIHSDEYPTYEFNARMNLEAYHILLSSANPENVNVLPFSQAKFHFNLSKRWREEFLGRIDTDIVKVISKYEKVAMNRSDRWQKLNPAVIAIAIKQDLVEDYKYSKNSVVLYGNKRGMVTN